MNEMKVFENTEFGDVRTISKNENIWFVAKDIAKALGYSNPQKAIRDHCKGVNATDLLTSGGNQTVKIIKESDVYRLIMKSKLKTAINFQDWLVDDVLPSIRKTGKYEMKKTLPDFNDPIEAAEAWLKEAKAKKLLAEKLENEKDKIEFYNAVADTKGADPMGKVAKVLDLGIGRNQLFSFLRNNGILMDDNEPYQRYMTSGYFKVVMYKYESSGNIITHYKTLVTKKGVNFILKKYLEKYPECSKSDVDQIIQKATNMTVNETTDNKEI